MTPKSPLIDILAQNLRYFRHQLGISQEELADICQLHRTYIGSVERSERNITLSTFIVDKKNWTQKKAKTRCK
ncbi:MAG TPA: helix-turn-helix transcriptional regulator, partial [Anaerolineaceae bacterium]|nr:helix-turn-helix transcriptional regulator [Anaerolineaceae bacterium]HPN50508.1 helix-turn-helix transcriptional regulator [Anaerolineaceae bacterium]